MQKQSFHTKPVVLEAGDVDKAFAEAKHVLEGEVHMGGQEHFYLETQACVVVPKNEDDELEITSSTQNPSETQVTEQNPERSEECPPLPLHPPSWCTSQTGERPLTFNSWYDVMMGSFRNWWPTCWAWTRTG